MAESSLRFGPSSLFDSISSAQTISTGSLFDLESGDLPASILTNDVHEILVALSVLCDGDHLVPNGIPGLLRRNKHEGFEGATSIASIQTLI